MNEEAWRRGYNEGRKFTIPRVDDDMTNDFSGSISNRSGGITKLFSALIGFASLISVYASGVFLIVHAFGEGITYRNSLIIAGCVTVIRFMDSAVMRNMNR
jgi:hypothetical protein